MRQSCSCVRARINEDDNGRETASRAFMPTEKEGKEPALEAGEWQRERERDGWAEWSPGILSAYARIYIQPARPDSRSVEKTGGSSGRRAEGCKRRKWAAGSASL